MKKNLVIAGLFLSFASQAVASSERDHYFFRFHVPTPPAPGSSAYDRDYAILHELQDTRTAEMCEAAGAQSKFSFKKGFGDVLTQDELKKAKVLSLRVIAKAALPIFYFKQLFRRARPFNQDSTLNPCISKPGAIDFSYPSGHSATGYALGLVLARKFPEKAEALIKAGIQVGDNRLIGGVHHPSDVEAGRELAAQLVQHMFVTRAFDEPATEEELSTDLDSIQIQ